jgi:dTDP-4-dehydrorhamnose 3,5-epimerase-like enzyme
VRGGDIVEKVSVEKLAVTKDITGAKRWTEAKGEFVQISHQEEIRHLALFEIRKGFFRGSHYHRKKEEVFYIVRGRIRARFVDTETDEREESILEEGAKIRIEPLCGHLLEGVEDSIVVEYSPQFYDIEDNYRIEL